MAIIYITMFVCIVSIVVVLVWFALQDQDIACNSNGCTRSCRQGRTCTCGWPGTTEQCQPNCQQNKT